MLQVRVIGSMPFLRSAQCVGVAQNSSLYIPHSLPPPPTQLTPPMPATDAIQLDIDALLADKAEKLATLEGLLGHAASEEELASLAAGGQEAGAGAGGSGWEGGLGEGAAAAGAAAEEQGAASEAPGGASLSPAVAGGFSFLQQQPAAAEGAGAAAEAPPPATGFAFM